MTTPTPIPAVSWTAVARHDVLGHIVAWMLGFVLLVSPAALLYSVVTGWRPQEPWSEVFAGVGAIALAGYVLLRWRAARITQWLTEARHVDASVLQFVAVGVWAVLRVSYEIDGDAREGRITVPHTKRSARLGREARITLAVALDGRAAPVVLDLYRDARVDSGRVMP